MNDQTSANQRVVNEYLRLMNDTLLPPFGRSIDCVSAPPGPVENSRVPDEEVPAFRLCLRDRLLPYSALASGNLTGSTGAIRVHRV